MSDLGKQSLTPLQKYENSKNKSVRIFSKRCQDIWLHWSHNKVLDQGAKKSLDFDDLWLIDERFKYDYNCNKYNSMMNKEREDRLNHAGTKRVPKTVLSQGMVLIKSEYWAHNFSQIIAILSQIPAPILIKKFIEWLSDESASNSTGYIVVSILVLINFINPTFELISDHYMSLAVLRHLQMIRVSSSILLNSISNLPTRALQLKEYSIYQVNFFPKLALVK